MAETQINPAIDDGSGAPGWSSGDFAKAVGASAASTGASLAAGAQAASDESTSPGGQFVNDLSRVLHPYLSGLADSATGSMNPEARSSLEAALGSKEFWEHPVLSSALKGAGMTPQVAAVALPGGLVAGTLAKVAVASTAGGALSAAQVVEDINKEVASHSDKELQKLAPIYAAARASGISEEDARQDYQHTLYGMKPTLNALIGAAAGVLGPAGKLAGIGEASERGLAGRVAHGGVEGAVAMGGQAGVENASVQNANIEGGTQKDFDTEALVKAVLEPTIAGGVIGGVVGVATGRKAKAKAPAKDIAKETAPEVTPESNGTSPETPAETKPAEAATIKPEDVNDAMHNGTTGVQPKPPENVDVGNPQSAPTRSATSYPNPNEGTPEAGAKGKKAKGVGKKRDASKAQVETVPVLGPDQEQARALAPDKPEVIAKPPDNNVEPIAQPVRVASNDPSVGMPRREAPLEPPTPGAEPAVEPAKPVAQAEPSPEQARPPEIVSAPAAVEVPAPAAPRILQDVSTEGKAARRAQEQRIASNMREGAKLAGEDVVDLPSHKGAAADAQKASDSAGAKEAFDRNVPDEITYPQTPQDREQLRQRIKQLLDTAGSLGVKIPAKVTLKTSDHLMFLKEASDLYKGLLKNGWGTTAAGKEHIQTFLGREMAAREGDFSVMREGRKVEGDAKAASYQGDVELKAAPSVGADAFEKEGVVTNVAKSAKGAVRDSRSEELPASAVRKVELTPEMKAKYEALANNKEAGAKGKEVLEKTKKVQKTEPQGSPPIRKSEVPATPVTPKGKATEPEVIKKDNQTNTSPTDAQKSAGNYKMEHRSFQGLDISVENPKGSIRSGKDENGKPWSVKMPADYGYIKRTEGADGDHVDVHVGEHPDSDTAYVIDQNKRGSETFDEHKAFVGMKDMRDATDTYMRSFSDGSASERFGGITPMPMEQFKEWAHNGDTKKPLTSAGNNGVEAARLTTEDLEGKTKAAPRATQEDKITANNGESAAPIKSYKLSEILPKFDLASHGPLFTFIRKKLMDGAGDVKVHLLEPEDIDRLAGGHVDGLYHNSPENGEYIALNADLGHEQAVRAIVHEGVHALTLNAIHSDPALKADISHLMKAVNAAHGGEFTADRVYAFTNEGEFIAEAWGNKALQEMLRKTPLDAETASRLGLSDWRKYSLWSAFVQTVRKALRLPGATFNALEGAIALTERASRDSLPMDAARADINKRFMQTSPGDRHSQASLEAPLASALSGKPQELIDALTDKPLQKLGSAINDMVRNPNIPHAAKKALWYATPDHQFADWYGHLFKNEERVPGEGGNVLRRISDLSNQMGARATELKQPGLDLVSRLMEAEKATPDASQRFDELVNQATKVGVDPSTPRGVGRNKGLSLRKELQDKVNAGATLGSVVHDAALDKIESIRAHEGLAREFEAIVKENPDLKKLLPEIYDYYQHAQSEMGKGLTQNILEDAHGLKGDELQKRTEEIHALKSITGQVKDDLTKEFGEATVSQLAKIKQVSGRDVPYTPAMRHGDFVVHGKYKVTEPGNAIRKVSDDEWEFKTRKEAADFAHASGLHHELGISHYDPGTNTRVGAVAGISTAGSPEARYSVTLQRQHAEFHEKLSEASRALEALKASGATEQPRLEQRSVNKNLDAELTSGGMRTILKQMEQQEAYKRGNDVEKAAMRKTITDAAAVMMGGNHVQSRRLPRRRVAGESTDIRRNLMEYNSSQANYRAKVAYRPQIDEAITDMHAQNKNMYDKNTTLRSMVAHEMEGRARSQDPTEYSGKWAEIAKRLGTWSYVDRMVRASHLLLHQTHLPMISMPIIAGRHGPFATYGMMGRTWRTAMGTYRAGGDDFIKSFGNTLHKGTDFEKLFNKMFAGEKDAKYLGELFHELNNQGIIHPSSGQEVERFNPARKLTGALGLMDNTMNYLDLTFRHATNATEAINRYVGATTAYRLEFARLTRQGNKPEEAHLAAINYARGIIENTQGKFTPQNAAPLFKNKALRPFLQFKQFPQMIYHLLVSTAAKVLDKGATTEERVEAAKSLIYVLGAHVAMTGVLGGLPLEAFKIAGFVSKGLGLTDNDWTDVERGAYARVSKQFGPTTANYVMHGAARLSGADMHHRLGLNSFFTFGLPDTKIDKTNVLSFIGQTAMGAPGGLVADSLRGLAKMAGGDMAAGAEQALPLQALRDLAAAYNGGTKSYKYSPAERGAKLLGFTPSGQAESAERSHDLYAQTQEFSQKRAALIKSWVDADSMSKGTRFTDIQRWNQGVAGAGKITLEQLTASAKRKNDTSKGNNTLYGVKFNKQTQGIKAEANAMYGIGK